MLRDNKLVEKITYYLAVIWIFVPFLIMALNIASVECFTVIRIWKDFVWILGGIALVLDIPYLLSKIRRPYIVKEILKALSPVVVLLMFLIWTFISCIFSPDKHMAIWGDLYRNEGFVTYLFYAGFVAMGLVLVNSKTYIKKLANIFVVSASIQSVIALCPFLQEKILYKSKYAICVEEPLYQGAFANSNHFAYFILLAILVDFFLLYYSNNQKEKIVYLLTFVLLMNLLLMNNTLGTYVALTVTLCFICIWQFFNKHDKSSLPYLCLIIVISFVFISSLYGSGMLLSVSEMIKDIPKVVKFIIGKLTDKDIASVGTDRGKLWIEGFKSIARRPVLGWGLDNGVAAYATDPSVAADRPHNTLIQMAMFTGVPGLVLYCLTYLISFARLHKQRLISNSFVKSSSFIIIGYSISAFFGNTMFYTSPYYLVFFGICISGCLNGIDKD